MSRLDYNILYVILLPMPKARPAKPSDKLRIEPPEVALARTARQLSEANAQNDTMRLALSAYKAAAPSRTRMEHRAIIGSGDGVLGLDRSKIVDFSRNLEALSPAYSGMLDRIADIVVGDGLKPIGNTPAAVEACEAFKRWSENHADARQLTSGGHLQWLMFRSMVRDGDIAAIRTQRPSTPDPQFPTSDRCLQLVEGDLIVSPGFSASMAGTSIFGVDEIEGVKLDEYGAPKTFRIAKYGQLGTWIDTAKLRDVDAGFVLFLAHRIRASQTRGIPMLASALDRLQGMEDAIDGVEAAVRMAAFLVGYIKSASPGAARTALKTSTQTSSNADGSSRVDNLMALDPATLLTLGPNESLEAFQSAHPMPAFDPFIQSLLRLTAHCAGFPVEVLFMDNSRANFSVSRMAQLQAQKTARRLRSLFISRVCQPTYQWIVASLIQNGDIAASDAPETYDIKWLAPPMDFIDPMVEAQTAKLLIDENLLTKDDFLESRGYDWESVMEQRQKERQREEELGITPPTVPGSKTGQEKEAEPEDDSENEDNADEPTPPTD